jgi:Tetratricopeptide repeat
MNCPECGHDVPGSSAFCADCGARLVGVPDAGTCGTQPGVRALLTRANLLRVRGQWEAAAEQCAQVMRLDPHNAAAHSLLGEIYDNQGHLERAIRWYEEALELNPHSVADRAKLARAQELLLARQQPSSGRVRSSGFSWLRVAGIAGAIICGGIILLAVLLAEDHPSARGEAQEMPFVHRTTTSRASSALRWLTTQERAIGSQVAAGVRPPWELVVFQIDPRDRSVEAGLALDLAPYRQTHAGVAIQERLLLDVYAIAHRVAQEYPGVVRVRVRVVARNYDGSGNSEFRDLLIATLLGSALSPAPEIVTGSDLARIYENTWWNPQVLL